MNAEQNIEQTGFNEAKRDILGVVNDLGAVTSWQIALITDRTPEAASMCLFRYHGMGLLNRRTLKGRLKIYTLTKKGQERLTWLTQNEQTI